MVLIDPHEIGDRVNLLMEPCEPTIRTSDCIFRIALLGPQAELS